MYYCIPNGRTDFIPVANLGTAAKISHWAQKAFFFSPHYTSKQKVTGRPLILNVDLSLFLVLGLRGPHSAEVQKFSGICAGWATTTERNHVGSWRLGGDIQDSVVVFWKTGLKIARRRLPEPRSLHQRVWNRTPTPEQRLAELLISRDFDRVAVPSTCLIWDVATVEMTCVHFSSGIAKNFSNIK